MISFKCEKAGLSRAKAGVMRRLSMVALCATARHVLHGLAIVAPPCVHEHNAREAARRAHLDAFGAGRRGATPLTAGACSPRAAAGGPARLPRG